MSAPVAGVGGPTRLDAAGRSLLFTGAHTATAFTDAPVPEALLRELVELARWPPTGANGNPLRIAFVRTPAARERLLRHLAPAVRAKAQGAPVTAILAFDPAFHERLGELFPRHPGMRERYAADPVAGERAARLNAALQAGYLLLAARAVGLAVGPVGGFVPDAVDRDLLADRGWRSFLVLTLGYPAPAAYDPRLPRPTYDELTAEL